MDSAEFHAAVYDTVRLIPACRVTSYGVISHIRVVLEPTSDELQGHIAKLIGMPNHSRHVGQALKFLPPTTNPPVPWHRVIGASGAISSRGPGTQGAQRQAEALTAEGVEVSTGRTGELRVDFGTFGWFPRPGQVPGVSTAGFDEEPDEPSL